MSEPYITRTFGSATVTMLDLPASPAPAPWIVSMRQARLALLAAGKLAAVDAAINAMPEPERTQAQITWEYAAELERNHPLVLALAAPLGLSDDDIDALFTAAAAIA